MLLDSINGSLYIWILVQRIYRWCKLMFSMNDALWTCAWTPQLRLGLKHCLQMSRVQTMVDDLHKGLCYFCWHIWVRCNNKWSGRWDPEIPIAVVLNNAVLRRSWERPNGTCPQWTCTFSWQQEQTEKRWYLIYFLYPVLPSLSLILNASWTLTPTVVTVVICCHIGNVLMAIVHTVSA